MKKLKILLCGASGFIGSNLTKELVKEGHEVIFATKIHLKDVERLSFLLEDIDGIINLCGAPLLRRWSEEYKKEIYDSRVLTTQILSDACFLSKKPPSFFISASSVAIYTNVGIHDEDSNYYGIDYLSFLAKDWEKEALRVEELDMRVVILRMGAVLGKDGGVIEELKRSINLGICSIPGDGKQSFSWISIDDLIKFIKISIKDDTIKGVYNLVSTQIIDMNTFFKALGKVLRRPVWRYVPIEILKMRYKEGYEVLIKTAYAKPKRVLDSGFKYKFNDIYIVLKELIHR